VIIGEPPQLDDGAFTQELTWLAHDGSVALREQRSIGWTAIDQHSWRLMFESRLRADAEAQLNSPGSRGRIGGGYGGFFWRFPACDNVEVFTAEARGEDEVQGSLGPWLAWSADFAAGPGISGPATIVITAPDAAEAGEPWFVRLREYPAVGSALAWDRPASLAAASVLRRRFDVAVADGRLSEAETRDLAAEVTAARL
jgi:hypothetical protein